MALQRRSSLRLPHLRSGCAVENVTRRGAVGSREVQDNTPLLQEPTMIIQILAMTLGFAGVAFFSKRSLS